MSMTSVAEQWVNDAAALTAPSRTEWCDGSKAEYDRLIEAMLRDGTLLPLNSRSYPNCYLHRSHPSDVARTEQLTFICTGRKEEAGPTNNWMSPADAKRKAGEYLKGAMRGRTMYVIPYLMGPVGSVMSRTGIMVTDSAYVVASMHIMTRVGEVALAWGPAATGAARRATSPSSGLRSSPGSSATPWTAASASSTSPTSTARTSISARRSRGSPASRT
jgi:phosphoenolpyruvate carboxykinase (GTP)